MTYRWTVSTPVSGPASSPKSDRYSGTSETPTDLEKLRLDYAWKYFSFHADQRTKMFNFMLLGMGIFATALVTAIDKKLDLEAALLSTGAAIVALVFCLLDRRNRALYVPALEVLRHTEDTVLFGVGRKVHLPQSSGADSAGDAVFGIASRTAIVDKDSEQRSHKIGAHWDGMLQGQHRYWLPAIALGFAGLFALAALRCWLVYSGAIPQPWVLAAGILGPLSALCFFGWMSCTNPLAYPFGWAGIAVGVLLIYLSTTDKLQAPIRHGNDIQVTWDIDNEFQLRIRQPNVAEPAALGIMDVARFGPFAPGGATLDCQSADVTQAIGNVRDAMRTAVANHQRPTLLMIGSTDRQRLAEDLRRQYGSDAGLASARVTEVKRCLASSAPDLSVPEGLTLISGPLYTPANGAVDKARLQRLADDRMVRVLIVGTAVSR